MDRENEVIALLRSLEKELAHIRVIKKAMHFNILAVTIILLAIWFTLLVGMFL